MKRGPYRQYEFRDSQSPVPRASFHRLTHPKLAKKRCRQETELTDPPPPKKRRFCQNLKLQPQPQPQPQPHPEPEPELQLQEDTSPNNCQQDSLQPGMLSEWIVEEETLTTNDIITNDNPEDEEEAFEFNCMDINDSIQTAVSPPDDPDHGSDFDSDDECQAAGLHFTVKDKIKLLLLLATKKKHRLSYSAAECIMSFAGVLSDEVTFFPTKHNMKAAIEQYSEALSVHRVCSNCESYIGPIETETIACNNCDEVIRAQKKKEEGNIFLYLPIEGQLKALLNSGVSEKLVKPEDRKRATHGGYEDIYDGKQYLKVVPNGCLSFNFFGKIVASTSKKSAWPVLVVVNELPMYLRRKHVLMACIWLGDKKPKMSEYLKPFVLECNSLSENGICIKVNNTPITFPIKALIVHPCINHFPVNCFLPSGLFGCGLCYHPGIRMRKGRGYARSYSIQEREYPERTHQETMDLARLAEESGTVRRGVKGVSVLAGIDGFDVIRSIDLDFFHALVNCSKRFCSLWFSKIYAGSPFNISQKLADVDRRLLAITITDDVSRSPRSLLERSDYRGHEWFYWVAFYSIPVLKNILPNRFLNHWALLVHSTALLMQNAVTKSEVAYAERYLRQFNFEIDDLYRAVHVTFSIHLMTHLARSVTEFGQPWTHSAFVFESFNGELKNAVMSSNGVAQQITKHMQLRIALITMRNDLEFAMNDKEKEYLRNVMACGKKLAEPHLKIGSVSLLGTPQEKVLPLDALQALTRATLSPSLMKTEWPSHFDFKKSLL
ncbi:NCK-interacting protein with SH3 domain [Frankliniella fusca]|uniref:NCK-interacting protein with SH3 domain n=1 Tax=Frankliniella fusca TaxID=407009 RepID=A0AAE1HBT2_9NEOP|nr:NCK-interacting protein with SH3 domain [Frankliniella fusca]